MSAFEIWEEGPYEPATWTYNPSGPFLIFLRENAREQTMSVVAGGLRRAVQRFMELPRPEGRGTAAGIIDARRRIVFGHDWTDEEDDRAVQMGCGLVFSELERLGKIHPVDMAFLEMAAKGDLDDL